MNVLGIETSCDETAVAVYQSGYGIITHEIYSQVEVHREYGGVVPELASRDHIRKLVPMIRRQLDQAGLETGGIDAIAYTAGPGLIGALLVGAAVGRSLAWTWGIPAVAIHHMEGHMLAPMLEDPAPAYPFIALLVSGGHTMLVKVAKLGQYRLLGQTLDDAVGEAFDKTAKLLELPYPGGPAIEMLARQGDPLRFSFPRPMTDRPGLDFSFSGLKTHAVNSYRSHEDTPQLRADIALAFQSAAIETLRLKSRRALEQEDLKQLVIAGGVGANQALRDRFERLATKEGFQIFYPRTEYCTDNAAMIAYAGYLRLCAGQSEPLAFNARARWSLTDLSDG